MIIDEINSFSFRKNTVFISLALFQQLFLSEKCKKKFLTFFFAI